MSSKKEMSKIDILNLQLLQQTDQVEAWVRDNGEQLLDSFCNDLDLDDEDYDESMYMASSWALAQILNKQKESFYNEEDPEKLKNIVNKITWKDVVFFLLSIFTRDIIDMLESSEEADDDIDDDIDEDGLNDDLDEDEILDMDEEEFDNLDNDIDEDDEEEDDEEDDEQDDEQQNNNDGYNYYELISLGCVLAAIADINTKKKAQKRRIKKK